MLKYLSFVREVSKLHGESAWRNYDESFRYLKENSNLPWQKPVEELRIKAIAANSLASKTTFQPFRGKQANRSFVKFYFAFNQGESASSFPVTSPICASHIGEIIQELGVKLTGSQIKTHGLPTPVQVEPLRYELQEFLRNFF